MIIIDHTEARSGTRMPDMTDVSISDNLEAITGADILVSPIEAPVSSLTLINMHLAEGAVLVQRKSLRDAVESTYDRMKSSLARMRTTNAKMWQCWILATGIFLPHGKTGVTLVGIPTVYDDGRVAFQWQITDVQYRAFMSARRRFRLRGGVFEILSCDDEIPGWLRLLEHDLQEMKNHPQESLYPSVEKFYDDSGDIFQDLKEVRDCRSILAAFSGLGPTKVDALFDTIEAWNKEQYPDIPSEPTLSQMLFWATAEDPTLHNLPKIPGWGPGIRQKIRDQVPLQSGQDFGIIDNGIYKQE